MASGLPGAILTNSGVPATSIGISVHSSYDFVIIG